MIYLFQHLHSPFQMEKGQITLMRVVAWGEATLVDQRDQEIIQEREAGTGAETDQGRELQQRNLSTVWFKHSREQGRVGDQFHAGIQWEDQHSMDPQQNKRLVLYFYLKILYLSWILCFEALLITFANSLDPDQAQQYVGPDLDPNLSTLHASIPERI